MQYYHVLISLLKPLTSAVPDGIRRSLASTTRFGTPPHELFLQAKACGEMLFRIYYLRHGFEFLDSGLLAFIPPLIFMSIEDIESGRGAGATNLVARQSTAVLLAKAIFDQGKSFYLAQVIFGLVRDRMQPEDFDLVRRFARVEEVRDDQDENRVEEVKSDWPVDIVGVTDDPDRNRLDLLLEQHRERSARRSAAASGSGGSGDSGGSGG